MNHLKENAAPTGIGHGANHIEHAHYIETDGGPLALIERGMLIFPVSAVDSKPLVRWRYGATPASNDPSQVRVWQHQRPDCRWGIATGDSGVVVIDLDTKNGVDGISEFAGLVAKFGSLPPTMRVRTKSGGLHLYFRHPGGKIKTTAGQLGPGIDVRGDGGYVVAPGSTGYSIVSNLPPAPMPEWLVALCRPVARIAASLPVVVQAPSRRWQIAIERECADIAAMHEGGRNRRLYDGAVTLSRFLLEGLDQAILRAALTNAAMRCGLPDHEAQATINSAINWRLGVAQ
jgi:hypothetical protein